MQSRIDRSKLVTETRNERSHAIDALDSLGIVDLIQKEDAEVLRAVRKVRKEIAAAIDMVVESIRDGGRLIYVGAGTSGRLGVLDASECPPTFGAPPDMVQGIIAGGQPALSRSIEGAEDRTDRARDEVRRRKVGRPDTVMGITASGTAPFVLEALRVSKKRGARTILLAFNPQTDTSLVDLAILPCVGPEVITGSTRMKAGTATKLILNTITTGAMVRLGKVYGNLMVDLQASNEKLKDRARRIVETMTGASSKEAEALLKKSRGDTKVAIVMQRLRVEPEEAKRRLSEADGILRNVIG